MRSLQGEEDNLLWVLYTIGVLGAIIGSAYFAYFSARLADKFCKTNPRKEGGAVASGPQGSSNHPDGIPVATPVSNHPVGFPAGPSAGPPADYPVVPSAPTIEAEYEA